MITSPKSRTHLIDLIPEDSHGCELGVFEADFSKELFDSGKFRILYLVDPFVGVIGSGDKDGKNHKSRNGEDLWNAAVNLEEWNEGIIVQRQMSVEFLKGCSANFLDFIYIDTTHRYEDTLRELKHSWRVAKKGGIVAGHDFNLEGAGVQKAVEEFCSEKNIDFNVLTGDGLHSFYFRR